MTFSLLAKVEWSIETRFPSRAVVSLAPCGITVSRYGTVTPLLGFLARLATCVTLSPPWHVLLTWRRERERERDRAGGQDERPLLLKKSCRARRGALEALGPGSPGGINQRTLEVLISGHVSLVASYAACSILRVLTVGCHPSNNKREGERERVPKKKVEVKGRNVSLFVFFHEMSVCFTEFRKVSKRQQRCGRKNEHSTREEDADWKEALRLERDLYKQWRPVSSRVHESLRCGRLVLER